MHVKTYKFIFHIRDDDADSTCKNKTKALLWTAIVSFMIDCHSLYDFDISTLHTLRLII